MRGVLHGRITSKCIGGGDRKDKGKSHVYGFRGLANPALMTIGQAWRHCPRLVEARIVCERSMRRVMVRLNQFGWADGKRRKRAALELKGHARRIPLPGRSSSRKMFPSLQPLTAEGHPLKIAYVIAPSASLIDPKQHHLGADLFKVIISPNPSYRAWDVCQQYFLA